MSMSVLISRVTLVGSLVLLLVSVSLARVAKSSECELMVYDLSSIDEVNLWLWIPSASDNAYNTTACVFSIVPLENQTISSNENLDTVPTCATSSWTKTFSIFTSNGTFSNWTLTPEMDQAYLIASVNNVGAFATILGVSHVPISVNQGVVSPMSGPLPVNCAINSGVAHVDNGKETIFVKIADEKLQFIGDDKKKINTVAHLSCYTVQNNNSAPLSLDFQPYPSPNDGSVTGPTLKLSLGFVSKSNKTIGILLGVGTTVLILVAVGVVLFLRKKKERESFEVA